MIGDTTVGGRFAPHALSLLRIVAALLFLLHGTAKILGFPETDMAAPPTGSLVWVAGMMELVGGLMLLFGILSRPVAFLLSGQMAVAYWMAHAPQSTYPMQNGGEPAILFCFVFLLIAAAGAGPWSVDATLKHRRDNDPEPGVEGYAAHGGERQYRDEDFGGGKL